MTEIMVASALVFFVCPMTGVLLGVWLVRTQGFGTAALDAAPALRSPRAERLMRGESLDPGSSWEKQGPADLPWARAARPPRGGSGKAPAQKPKGLPAPTAAQPRRNDWASMVTEDKSSDVQVEVILPNEGPVSITRRPAAAPRRKLDRRA